MEDDNGIFEPGVVFLREDEVDLRPVPPGAFFSFKVTFLSRHDEFGPLFEDHEH